MPANEHASVHAARRVVANEELMRMLLMGLTLREISRQTGMGYNTVRFRAREPEFLLKLKEHSGEIAQRLVDELSTNIVEMAQKLEDASALALEEMLKMMGELENPSQLKLKVCQDLLDRDPKSSRTKRMDITGTMSHDFISPAVLIHAAATAKELESYQRKQVENGNGSSDNPADR
jgi:hypothetical protein